MIKRGMVYRRAHLWLTDQIRPSLTMPGLKTTRCETPKSSAQGFWTGLVHRGQETAWQPPGNHRSLGTNEYSDWLSRYQWFLLVTVKLTAETQSCRPRKCVFPYDEWLVKIAGCCWVKFVIYYYYILYIIHYSFVRGIRCHTEKLLLIANLSASLPQLIAKCWEIVKKTQKKPNCD